MSKMQCLMYTQSTPNSNLLAKDNVGLL